jgi:hypothetical protein
MPAPPAFIRQKLGRRVGRLRLGMDFRYTLHGGIGHDQPPVGRGGEARLAGVGEIDSFRIEAPENGDADGRAAVVERLIILADHIIFELEVQ